MTEDHRSPGSLLQALLSEKQWTNRSFAAATGIEETDCSRLIGDKKPVTAKLAIRFEEVFGIPAERFLDLQARFDLAVERLKRTPDQGQAKRGLLKAELPISTMIKRGWLDVDSVRDRQGVDRALSLFFETGPDEEVDPLPHAAKRTQVSETASPVQLAWVYRVRQIATEMIVAPYSPASGRAAIEKLKPLLVSAEAARKVPKILAEHGIRFVVVESLPSGKIDGVCFWLDDRSPVIGMTMRYDRIDNFWFVLRHELEHVIQGHGKSIAVIDSDLEGENGGLGDGIEEQERVANLAAGEFLVPRLKLEAFVIRKAPFFAERDIVGFAKTLGVHPGLVAGPLQRRIGKYNLFREHLEKVRSIVLPGAMSDGWGNVAPVGE